MKIAIVGTGISGLVAAHHLQLRPRDHRLRGGGADRWPHPHRRGRGPRPASKAIDTGFIVFNDRNYPNFEALLGELGVAHKPIPHELLGQRWPRRLRVLGDAPGPLACPAHLVSPTFLRMIGEWRRFNRLAPGLIGMNGTAPSLGAWLEQRGLLPALHRPPDRPPGLRRLVRRPGADVELPGQLHGRVLRQPRHVQPARPAAAGGPSRGGSRSLRRGDRGAVARPRPHCARRCGGSSACPTRSGSRPTAARPRSFDQRRHRHPLRPGAGACSATRARPSARCSARSPTSATRPSSTPTPR